MARRTDKDKEKIKTTREIINQAKANGLSVKETRKAVEANKALKEEKLKQEIKEAKEKHNALKENDAENLYGKEGEEEIKGENFTIKKDKEAKSDLNVKMQVEPYVRDLANLTSQNIKADLYFLAKKHPEMFKKPSDAFKLLKEIKENPTFFYKNNRMDIALIAKRLEDDKLGKLGIDKETGEVRHLTKSRNADKENERIHKRDGKSPLAESPYSAQPILSEDSEPTADGVKTLLKGNEDFTQKEHKPSLSESEANQPLSDNQSTTIQANQHLGAGLFGGMINGLSEDENGNLTFNPQDFLKGFAAGGLGSLGMNKALKVIKQNPQLKRNLLNELKKSLSITHGDLAKVYPVFKNTQRFKATKKDKALNIQARLALKLLEKKRERDYGM